MTRGVVYAATGEKFVREANTSVDSLKRHNPSLPATLFTDSGENASDKFDAVKSIEPSKAGLFDFIRVLPKTPYECTLFLDTDTYVTEDISELFELLDKFELAISQKPGHIPGSTGGNSYIPQAFPQHNSGVILYKKTDAVCDVLSAWKERYRTAMEKRGYTGADEPFLREVLWEKDVDYMDLPPEYNCRFIQPGSVSERVKILHGRHPNIEKMTARLNKETGMRAYTGDAHRRIIAHPKPPVTLKYPGPGRFRHMFQRVKEIADEDGWRSALQMVRNRVPRLLGK